MEINVSVRDEEGNLRKMRIESSSIESKHLHVSGREFTADEVKTFKANKATAKTTFTPVK